MKLQYIISKYCIILFLFTITVNAQQDPQYTQYMYNTMSINPGYAGTRGNFSIVGLHRSQWVGLEGAPNTQFLGIESPVSERIGLGFNVINDEIGPSNEIYFDGNFSYTIPLGINKNLSFGLKAGIRFINVDFSKGIAYQQNDTSIENINSKPLPTTGAGIYYHHDTKWYLGLSVPNLITTTHYDKSVLSTANERHHFFLIGGYVLNLKSNLKFKPAFLIKAAKGTPISTDLSANFLYNDRITFGASYRWDDSIGAMAGFQINNSLFIGYAYDYTTTELNIVSNGSHEIMLRYDLINNNKIKSPRFF